MTTSYQNLNEPKPDGTTRHLSAGRVWLRRSGEWWSRRFGTLCLEWTVPCGHCGWSITFGGGDRGTNLGVSFAVPFLATLYVTIEGFFAKQLFAWDFDRGSSRSIGCYFHNWAFWYTVWVGDMASWSRDAPWCRWYRQGSIHFDDVILGRTTCQREIVKAPVTIAIPMPEGNYAATAEVERRIWKRPRWFAKTRVYTNVSVPDGGIPFAGKGENSWDCGDDGLCSYSVEGMSLAKAIAHGVESVLESRKRYGMPSDSAMSAATARRPSGSGQPI